MVSRSVFLSTDQVDPPRRDAYWREIFRPIFHVDGASAEDRANLTGTLQSTVAGPMLLAAMSFSRHIQRRDRQLIAHSGLDFYALKTMIDGTLHGDFDGHFADAYTGDLLIQDMSRPYTLEMSAGRCLVVVVQRSSIEAALRWQPHHGTVLKYGTPLAGLLVDYLHRMQSIASALSNADLQAAQDALASMLTVALSQASTGQAGGRMTTSHILRSRLLEFIDQNLLDAALTPELLMQQFNISRSHLYRAFDTEGGVATVIRDKRMELAWRYLAAKEGAQRSIKDIAAKLGFSTTSRFIRAFRNHFGMTPGMAQKTEAPLEHPNNFQMIQDHFEQTFKLFSF